MIEQRRARDRFGRTRDEHHRDEGVGHGESKADLHLDAVTAAEAIVRPVQRGNILGRIGSGKRVIDYDSHIDTVGDGDRDSWGFEPFKGKIERRKIMPRVAWS